MKNYTKTKLEHGLVAFLRHPTRKWSGSIFTTLELIQSSKQKICSSEHN